MGTMPMDGGAAWPGAAASFVAMWTVMMVIMMLPSLAPTLWHYRRALAANGVPRPGWRTVPVGLGYIGVWSAVGVALFPLDAALAAAGLRLPALARAVPLAVGMVVVVSGAIQLTAWKARHLARCREASKRERSTRTDAISPLRDGVRLGADCVLSCVGAMAILFAMGAMDLGAMAVATLAISAERLAPDGVRVARVTGAVAVVAGLLLVTRAAGGG